MAFLLGGAFVFYSGLLGMYGEPDCSNLSPTECSFAHESAANVGRLQLIFGAGMIALAIAVYVLWRTRSPRTEGQP
ncbi:MAG: hypothetical protein ACJ790_18145 [Myxococcaceae bacterium]